MNTFIKEYSCGDAKLKLRKNDTLALCVNYYNDGDVNRCIYLTKMDIERFLSQILLLDNGKYPAKLISRGGFMPYEILINKIDEHGFLHGSFNNHLFGLIPIYGCPLVISTATIKSLANELKASINDI